MAAAIHPIRARRPCSARCRSVARHSSLPLYPFCRGLSTDCRSDQATKHFTFGLGPITPVGRIGAVATPTAQGADLREKHDPKVLDDQDIAEDVLFAALKNRDGIGALLDVGAALRPVRQRPERRRIMTKASPPQAINSQDAGSGTAVTL